MEEQNPAARRRAMSEQLSQSMQDTPLVDAAWLKAHHDDVLILDASIDRNPKADGNSQFRPGGRVFEEGHIPGARFADLFAAFSDPDAPFPFTRPSLRQVEAEARAVGINNDSTVVVYDTLGGAWAARLWWVLLSFGLADIRVLNGGLKAWTAIGGAIETGPADSVPPGNFVARALDGFFVGKEEVLALLETDGPRRPLVCGVRHEQYTGLGSDDPRAGHIPGSISLPYHALVGEDGLIDIARVKALIREKGLDDGAEPVLYCGGGVNAAGLALALGAVGQFNPAIYDGSLNEWKADPDLPLVRGDG
jgi:thiosulfate/3-mercaptopyruvate sulfurtransferase